MVNDRKKESVITFWCGIQWPEKGHPRNPGLSITLHEFQNESKLGQTGWRKGILVPTEMTSGRGDMSSRDLHNVLIFFPTRILKIQC